MAFCLGAFSRGMSAFGRASKGAIAVEFGIVAGPLIAVLIFAYDIAANYLTFQQIDMAGQSIAAQMRSGQIDPAQYSGETFRQQVVCPAVQTLTCARVVVNLARLSSGAMISSANVAAPQWCAGGPLDALIFQIAYPVPFLSRIWAGGLADGNPHYVSSFGLRNARAAAAGAC